MNFIKPDRLERLRWWYRRNAWLLFVFGMLSGIVLAIWGFWAGEKIYFEGENKLRLADAAYYILQMVSLNGFGPLNPEMPWQLNVARFLLPFVFFFTAIAQLLRLVGRNGIGFQRFLMRDHVIICGSGSLASELARQYRLSNQRIKVLFVSRENDVDGFAALRSLGIHLHMDDVCAANAWRNLPLKRVKAIYFLDDDSQRNTAGYAALCSVSEKMASSSNESVCPCFIHISEPALRRWTIELYESSAERGRSRQFQWFIFSALERSARELFLRHGPHSDKKIQSRNEGSGILVLGASTIAEQLLLQAALLGHYPESGKLKVTVIDEHAERIVRSLQARYPALDKDLSHQWKIEERELLPLMDLEFINARPDAIPIKHLGILPNKEKSFQVCFVCVDDPVKALSIVEMLQAQHQHVEPVHWPRIVVCLSDSTGTIEKMSQLSLNNSTIRWTLFDPLMFGCRLEFGEEVLGTKSENDAQEIHRFFLQGKDFDWWALKESERESSRQAADHLKIKRFFPHADCDSLMSAEHSRWCAERLLAGWRYGSQKDFFHRTSPNLMRYEALSVSEREKNRSIVELALGTKN